jgi:hypothetical protein
MRLLSSSGNKIDMTIVMIIEPSNALRKTSKFAKPNSLVGDLR